LFPDDDGSVGDGAVGNCADREVVEDEEDVTNCESNEKKNGMILETM
jgi:hypothetical protein